MDFFTIKKPTAMQAMGLISECSVLRGGLSDKFFV